MVWSAIDGPVVQETDACQQLVACPWVNLLVTCGLSLSWFFYFRDFSDSSEGSRGVVTGEVGPLGYDEVAELSQVVVCKAEVRLVFTVFRKRLDRLNLLGGDAYFACVPV